MAVLPRFDNTIGALFVGFAVSTVLYGIFLVQMHDYYRRYPADKVGYKAIVAFLVLLQTLHQAMIGHSVYYYSVTNFLNVLALLRYPTWSLCFQIVVGALIGSIVKFFFTLRVWRFSKGNVWLTAFLLVLNFGQLALAIVFALKSYTLSSLSELVNLRVWGTVALGIGVLNDIGIAAALCYYLQTIRSSYSQANSLIRSLTLYAVNTGVLTSAMSLSTLLVYNFMPRNFIFAGCYFVLSKLYALSFIATLTTRQTIRGRGTDGDQRKSSITSDQQSHPLSLRLHPPAANITSQDVVSHEAEENGVSFPGSGEYPGSFERPNGAIINFTGAHDRLYYPGSSGNYP